jgi:G protein-coupled receptor 50
MVIGAILSTKKLHTSTNGVIFNLALSDLIVALLIDSFTVAGILTGRNYFMNNFELCIIIGSACIIGCGSALYNMLFLAFNRFIFINHKHLYSCLFSFKTTLIYCCLTWIIGFLLNLPNLSGIYFFILNKIGFKNFN